MKWYEDLYNRQVYLDLYAADDTRIAPREAEAVVRLLGLRPGQSVLDVCCGYGRHALELARRGFRVTGIDLAPRQIEEARRRAQAAGVDVRFVLGDVREMDFQAEFDACLNLFTSFGFFETEAENQAMLNRIAGATSPGGSFLLETWNREKVIREFVEREVEEMVGGVRLVKEWQFDALAGRFNWQNTVTFPDGRQERWNHSIRAYTLVELKSMLEVAGFRLEQVFGDWGGTAYGLYSEQMIVVARR